MKKIKGKQQFELFSAQDKNNTPKSVGVFDEVIFACHTDTATSILRRTASGMDQKDDDSLLEFLDIIRQLEKIEYADNVIYLHKTKLRMKNNHNGCGIK